MSDDLTEGAVYKIDLNDGKPAHYWIVLNNPRLDGSFMAVSLTDRHNAKWNFDIWPYNYTLTEKFRLPKPSVVATQFVKIQTRDWLVEHTATFIGVCTPEALIRARCNTFWYDKYMTKSQKEYRDWFKNVWKKECGAPPENPNK